MEAAELKKLEGKNWVGAMMLCWLFGALGAHRFYTGKSNSAWAMAIMSITGCLYPISFIWSFIDGIAIALGKFTHEDGSPLYERINWLGYVYIILMSLSIIGFLLYFLAIIGVIATAFTAGAGSSVPPVAP